MTRDEIERVRMLRAIQTEVQIISAIPAHHFSGVASPHLLGDAIRAECVQRINDLIDGTALA